MKIEPSRDPDQMYLPPLTVADVEGFTARLKAMSTKSCDVATNCTRGASRMINIHDCHQVASCDDHFQSLNYEWRRGVSEGWVRCPDCGGEFTSVDEVMQSRRI